MNRKENKYFRKCPNCNKNLGYKNKRWYEITKRKNSICFSCVRTGKYRKFLKDYRICSKCNDKIFYKNRHCLLVAENKGGVCKSCSRKKELVLKRICSTCQKEISYKSKGGYFSGNKNNSLCKSCANKGKNNPSWKNIPVISFRKCSKYKKKYIVKVNIIYLEQLKIIYYVEVVLEKITH